MKTIVTTKEYENAVRKARTYVQKYDKVRWIICDLALSVCDCQLGGRDGSRYSIAKFASDIELNKKTLYHWINAKKLVYDKLPGRIKRAKNIWTFEDLKIVSNKVEPDYTQAQLKKVWDEHFCVPPESRKFAKYIRHLNAILYNCQRPMIMKDVEEMYINEVIEKCQMIINLLKSEMALREKFKGDNRGQKMSRLNIKKELAKRIAQA